MSAGHTLLELQLSVVLAGVILAGASRLFLGLSSLAREQAARREAAEVVRVASAVLDGDLRFLDPAADLRSDGDELWVRAFRGFGVVCGTDGTRIRVRYRGWRHPGPAKDSVLLLGDPVGGAPLALRDHQAAPGSCPAAPDETVAAWTLDTIPAAGTPVLWFESGAYGISAGALRYRRGASGRQPLTPGTLDERASALRLLRDGGAPPAAVAADLTIPHPPAPGRPTQPPATARLRIPFLNAVPLPSAPAPGESP